MLKLAKIAEGTKIIDKPNRVAGYVIGRTNDGAQIYWNDGICTRIAIKRLASDDNFKII